MIQPNVDISTLTAQSAVNRLEALSNVRNEEKEIDKVASEFQLMFYENLVKSMFSVTEDSALWGNSHASGILRAMFIEAVARSGGAESLNIKASIKKSLYNNMATENIPEIFAGKEDKKQKREPINVLL